MQKASREDVIACYRNILGRDPESEDVVEHHVGADLWELIGAFSSSKEHCDNIKYKSSCSIRKFLRENYLSRSLSVEQRAAALIGNYSELKSLLLPSALVALFERGLPLIRGLSGCLGISVDAMLFDPNVDEGEISLVVSNADVRLAVMAFTIIDGADFSLPAGRALLVSRIQGYRGVAEQTRAVSKALGDVPMPHLLMAVLEGFGTATNCGAILSVDGRNHPAFHVPASAMFAKAYDDLLMSFGASRVEPGFFHMFLPRTPRPLTGSKSHRSRRKARREIRLAIAECAQRGWVKHLKPCVAAGSDHSQSPRDPLKLTIGHDRFAIAVNG